MKQVPLILSSLAFIGVLVLFGMHIRHHKSSGSEGSVTSGTQSVPSSIAYVDIDTFEDNYIVLKNKKAEFARRQSDMETELQRSAQQMQNDYNDLQKRAQARTLSEAEGQAAQKRLSQMQQSLETRKQAMTEQLLKEQEIFNDGLHKQLDDFLEVYNKDKHYDYILSYSRSNPVIMYANKALNITKDVIKGMNERAGSKTDTTKGK